MVILHDSLFKHISDHIMKKENVKVEKVWTPRLDDVHQHVIAMQEKPKAVVVHCGTNDLQELSENDMVDAYSHVQEVLETRGIQMVFNFITPRGERKLCAKAEVVNSRVAQLFAEKESVFIARNDRLYRIGSLNNSLFDKDEIHVNEDGSRILASLTKDAICKALKIEVKHGDKHGRNNNRHWRRYRQ